MIAALVLSMILTVDPAEAAVAKFYAHVTQHQPLGIPEGDAKAKLWPLMTPRLQQVLETASRCEADYVRQHEGSDEKPEFGWLEHGLFSGGNERALPVERRIVSRGKDRVKVQLTYRDASIVDQWNVDVLVVCERGKCLVDDVIEFDEAGKPYPPLTKFFAGCDGEKWVGRNNER